MVDLDKICCLNRECKLKSPFGSDCIAVTYQYIKNFLRPQTQAHLQPPVRSVFYFSKPKESWPIVF
jgi:hypothetical protein